MKLQVVSGLKRAKNETTSWFQFQTTENEATSCFQLQTSLEWSLKLFPTSIFSIMKLQVDSELKRVKNETTTWFQFQTTENEDTSCFQLQTSVEWSYKLFTTSIQSSFSVVWNCNQLVVSFLTRLSPETTCSFIID